MATATRSERAGLFDRRLRRPDVVLLTTVAGLTAFGLLMIFSVTRLGLERSNQLPTVSMERQMLFATAGMIVVLLVSMLDYRELRGGLPLLYGITLLLLVAVFVFDPIKGAQRWIPLGFFNLQPAEIAKIVSILTTAHVLSSSEEPGVNWRKVLQSGALMAVPAALVFLEPDLGTAVVFVFVWLAMLFAGGIRLKRIAGLVGSGLVAVVAMFRLGFLSEYQLDRLRVFVDPSIDPQGIGYNLRQSKLAIGSGQLLGKGLFQGSQTNLSYVPEQETDFVFTAVGEQLGFVGGILVLAAFLVVVWRLISIGAAARDRFGALTAAGSAALVTFHVFVNIGMTIGIAPVTGLPLPFLSQGGSFYVTMALMVGIANSIWLRRSYLPSDRFRP